MRFESKHGPLKRHAHVVCNFINISKTLAYKNQVQSMFNWKFSDPLMKNDCHKRLSSHGWIFGKK